MHRIRGRLLLVTLTCLVAAGLPALAGDGSPSGWIGVFLGSGDRLRADSTSERAPGVRISGVVVDGPAARAGLRASDRARTKTVPVRVLRTAERR